MVAVSREGSLNLSGASLQHGREGVLWVTQKNLCLKGHIKDYLASLKATETVGTSLKTQMAIPFITISRSEATQDAKAGRWQIQV